MIWILFATCVVVPWGEDHVYKSIQNGAAVNYFKSIGDCRKSRDEIRSIGHDCKADCLRTEE